MDNKYKNIIIIIIIIFSFTLFSYGNIITKNNFSKGEESNNLSKTVMLNGVDNIEKVEEYSSIIKQYNPSTILVKVSKKNIDNLSQISNNIRIINQNNKYKVNNIDKLLNPNLFINEYNEKEKGLYLINLIVPTHSDWINTIKEENIKIIEYKQNNSYLTKMTPEKKEKIKEKYFVKNIDIYHPKFKLNTPFSEIEKNKKINIISLNKNNKIFNSENITILSKEKIENKFRITLKTNSEKMIKKIIKNNQIIQISKQKKLQLHDEMGSQIIGGGLWFMDEDDNPNTPYRKYGEYGAYINQIGYSGEGVTVAIADTGIGDGTTGDAGVEDFTNNKVIGGYSFGTDETDWTDENGHGTMGAGFIAGDTYLATGYDEYFGFEEGNENYYIAQHLGYNSELFSTKIFDNNGKFLPSRDSYYPIIEKPSQLSDSYIHSNSWGEKSGDSKYNNSLDEVYDQGVRDSNRDNENNNPMVILVSAGNNGSNEKTISSPGTAKNVITVGGSHNYNPDENYNNPEEIANFSSRGFTEDYRIKPDVVAPATSVWSQFTPERDGMLAKADGTSFSNPLVVGASTVVVEWYENIYNKKPSPAMVKSLLINTTNDISNDDPIPNKNEGWGMVDISKLEYPKENPINFELYDQESLLKTGDENKYYFEVENSNNPVKFTLNWTDEEGEGLKNNLDLKLTTPSGKTIVGNAFDNNGDGTSDDGFTYSTAQVMDIFDRNDDGYDDTNNIQNIFIPSSHIENGTYTLQVIGTNITSDSNNDGINNQDYALTGYNVLEDGYFDINIDEENSVLENTVGENISISVNVNNIGDNYDNQKIVLYNENTENILDNEIVELSQNENKYVNLDWSPTDNGNYELGVYSEDDNDFVDVKVYNDESYFDVKIIDSNTPTTIQENLEMSVNISNEGGKDNQNIKLLNFDENVVDNYDLELNPRENEIIPLIWDNTIIGRDNIIVKSENSSDNLEVKIVEEIIIENSRSNNKKYKSDIDNSELKVDLKYDSDNISDLKVLFYDNNDNLIDNITPSNSGVVSTIWENNFQEGKQYNFYSIVKWGSFEDNTIMNNFKINYKPRIEKLYPDNQYFVTGENGDVNLKSEIYDPDNENIFVEFYDNESDNLIDNDLINKDLENAEGVWENLEIGENYYYYVKVYDNLENNKSYIENFNLGSMGMIKIENITPNNKVYDENTDNVNLEFDVAFSDIDNVKVKFYNAKNDNLLQENILLNDNTVRFEWDNLENGEYEWYGVVEGENNVKNTGVNSFDINSSPVIENISPTGMIENENVWVKIITTDDNIGDNMIVSLYDNNDNLIQKDNVENNISKILLESLNRGEKHKYYVKVSDNIDNTISEEKSFHIKEKYDITLNVKDNTGGVINYKINEENYDNIENDKKFQVYENDNLTIKGINYENYLFKEWIGDINDNENSKTIRINKNYDITANFGLKRYLTINVEGNGNTIPSEGNHIYENGETVKITQDSEIGWKFQKWEGDGTNEGDNRIVEMNENKNVTSNFEKVKLIIENNESENNVYDHNTENVLLKVDTIIDETIDNAVVKFYDNNNNLINENITCGGEIKTKMSDINYDYNKWYATIEKGEIENNTETDNFYVKYPYYNLQVNTNGSGSVNITPDNEEYKKNTEVEINANPDNGWYFKEWTGDINETSEIVDIIMNENKEVNAVFEEDN
ncbi:MAG: S8 family serine peptidase, partial [archaeon]